MVFQWADDKFGAGAVPQNSSAAINASAQGPLAHAQKYADEHQDARSRVTARLGVSDSVDWSKVRHIGERQTPKIAEQFIARLFTMIGPTGKPITCETWRTNIILNEQLGRKLAWSTQSRVRRTG